MPESKQTALKKPPATKAGLQKALDRIGRSGRVATGISKELCEAAGVEFLDYQKSIDRLSEIIGAFEEKKAELVSVEHTPAEAFLLALKAQCTIIGQLNSQLLNCPIPWSMKTGFPSHPSLVADVAAYVKKHRPEERLGVVLASFGEWAHLFTEELYCSCTAKGISFTLRNIRLEIMIRHLFEEHREGGIAVRQMIGVRTDDINHFGHYEIKAGSQLVDHMMIIWICENRITLNPLTITGIAHEHADRLFDAESLAATMRELLEKTTC